MDDPPTPSPRRPPPPFRPADVVGVEHLTPRLVRVTVGGPDLQGFPVPLPAASVRLLLPPGRGLVLPTWHGNEFLLPDGTRPSIRTLTPGGIDPVAGRLAVDVVVHEGGALSAWATAATEGTPTAVSGPGRGYAIDPGATAFLVAGDETALPAIGQLLPHLPAAASVQVLVEVAAPDARLDLPAHPGATVTWLDLPAGAPPGDALVAAVRDAALDADARVWAAGEAAAVQRIRRHLFEERAVPRSHATVRGYWKHGRSGT